MKNVIIVISVHPLSDVTIKSTIITCPPLWTSNFGVLGFLHKLTLSLSLFLQNPAMTAQTQEELLAAHLEQQSIDVYLSLSLCIESVSYFLNYE